MITQLIDSKVSDMRNMHCMLGVGNSLPSNMPSSIFLESDTLSSISWLITLSATFHPGRNDSKSPSTILKVLGPNVNASEMFFFPSFLGSFYGLHNNWD